MWNLRNKQRKKEPNKTPNSSLERTNWWLLEGRWLKQVKAIKHKDTDSIASMEYWVVASLYYTPKTNLTLYATGIFKKLDSKLLSLGSASEYFSEKR